MEHSTSFKKLFLNSISANHPISYISGFTFAVQKLSVENRERYKALKKPILLGPISPNAIAVSN